MNNQVQLQKEFDKQLQEALKTTMFPKEAVENLFLENITTSLHKSSIMAVGCDLEIYDKIIAYSKDFRKDSNTEIDLFTISFMINLLEKTSPEYLGLSLYSYSEIVKATRRMATTWNDIVTPIKGKIQNKLFPQQKPKLAVVPTGKGNRKVGR